MKSILLKEGKGKAEVFIDGNKIDDVYSVKIEKTASAPAVVEIKAVVLEEVRVEPL